MSWLGGPRRCRPPCGKHEARVHSNVPRLHLPLALIRVLQVLVGCGALDPLLVELRERHALLAKVHERAPVRRELPHGGVDALAVADGIENLILRPVGELSENHIVRYDRLEPP
eukprot:gene10144-biopygen15463